MIYSNAESKKIFHMLIELEHKLEPCDKSFLAQLDLTTPFNIKQKDRLGEIYNRIFKK